MYSPFLQCDSKLVASLGYFCSFHSVFTIHGVGVNYIFALIESGLKLFGEWARAGTLWVMQY